MNSTVNLSFRYLESDYVRAVRAHCGSRARLGLSIVWAVVLAACGLYLWRSPGLQRLGLGFLIGSIICALILFAALTIIPSFSFRREPKFRDDYSLTFSPDGIRFCTAHVDSQLQWSMYSRALVDSHSYVLYYGSRQFTVIPKRVFQSAEQQQSFEQLLTQHISKIIRRV